MIIRTNMTYVIIITNLSRVRTGYVRLEDSKNCKKKLRIISEKNIELER